MKSYRHLYEQFLTVDNYELAVRNATKHKGGKRRKHRRARYYRDHMDKLRPRLMGYAENFVGAHHVPIEIYDGIRRKKRKIVVPTMPEQIVHHMVMNIMKPIFMRHMHDHSYGSIPDRGPHLAKRRIERWLRKGDKSCKYVLKMDIRKFFDSVPHHKLKAMLARVVHDRRFMAVLEAIIDSSPDGVGIPIGFYTSQWFANFYLDGLDRFISERVGDGHFVRYVDDIVIFGPNKRSLHKIRKEIDVYLNDELGLVMKDDWQVFLFDYVKASGKRVGRHLDFLGFRFYRDHTTLRRSIMLRATRKASRIGRKVREKGKKTVHDARQMLAYLGWLDCTDTYNMYRTKIKPFVGIGGLKRHISAFQRAMNRKESTCGIT